MCSVAWCSVVVSELDLVLLILVFVLLLVLGSLASLGTLILVLFACVVCLGLGCGWLVICLFLDVYVLVLDRGLHTWNLVAVFRAENLPLLSSLGLHFR